MSSESRDVVNALYAVTVSAPAALAVVPDMVGEKSHWVRNKAGNGEARGFVNPWGSSRDFFFLEIFKATFQ